MTPKKEKDYLDSHHKFKERNVSGHIEHHKVWNSILAEHRWGQRKIIRGDTGNSDNLWFVHRCRAFLKNFDKLFSSLFLLCQGTAEYFLKQVSHFVVFNVSRNVPFLELVVAVQNNFLGRNFCLAEFLKLFQELAEPLFGFLAFWPALALTIQSVWGTLLRHSEGVCCRLPYPGP